MANRVMNTLSDFSDAIECYSIDEAFARLYLGRATSFADIGRKLRERVLQQTGILVSVRVGETKTLAKVANYHAKRSEKARGVVDLVRSPYKDIALARLPIDEVWGVRPRYTELLKGYGINTALDLRDAPDDWVRERMTVVGARTQQELRGVPCIPLEITAPAKKHLTVSRTFGAATTSLAELRAAIAFYVARAAEKLRRQKLSAGTLTVFIENDRFKPGPQHAESATFNVAPKSDDTMELRELAFKGLARLVRAGHQYQRAGVTLGALDLAELTVKRLWEDAAYER